MTTKREISSQTLREFVRSLQSVAAADNREGGEVNKRLEALVSKPGQRNAVELTIRSTDSDNGTLRVLEPTASVVSAKINGGVEPASVEFYLTRPAGGDVVETKLLGVAKHPNSDGSWSVRFSTDRFAVSSADTLVVHAEVIGLDNRILAIAAMNPIS